MELDGAALALAIFLSATFAAAVVAGLAGFAFGLVAAAVWLHILTPLQTATLIIAFGVVVFAISGDLPFGRPSAPGAGMMPKPPQMPAHIPSYWMPYFMVTDVDGDSAKAKQLGGKVMVGPTDIPKVGRFAIIGDPQAAVFAIFTPAAR